GPDARRRPRAAREAYFLYVERAAEGANEADGPLSAACGRQRSRWGLLVSRLGTEELDESCLDLLVALLQLFRIDLQEVQVRELRLIGGGLHSGMARVESLAVGEDLLQLAAGDEIGGEVGGGWRGGEARDGAR